MFFEITNDERHQVIINAAEINYVVLAKASNNEPFAIVVFRNGKTVNAVGTKSVDKIKALINLEIKAGNP